MQIDKGVLRLGVEIEVPRWLGSRTFQTVARDLLEEGYMLGTTSTWASTHTYHCACDVGGCNLVRQGTLVDPPVVSMTYDATLPKTGAEFIMSPVLLASNGMPHFRRIWDIVTQGAEWTNKLKDIKDRACSPSVHLHISATQREPNQRANYTDDILHALSLFAPEFFVLADLAGVRRGLKYRLPERETIMNTPGGNHHGFVQVRNAVKSQQVYIEWRLFEAAYNDWPYVEAVTYMAAGLTRGLLDEDLFAQIMEAGYQNRFNSAMLRTAVRNDDTAAVISCADETRLSRLRDICVSTLDDDVYGQNVVREMFLKGLAKL